MTRSKTASAENENDESKEKRHAVNVALRPGETKSEAGARQILQPTTQAGATIFHYSKYDYSTLTTLIKQLDENVQKTIADDSLISAQDMLAAQAHTLDAIFNNLAIRAALNIDGGCLGAGETYLKVALRAQSQCRSTLEAISDIRHPKTATFVKQANIAHGHQQVNNQSGEASCAGEIENQPNELLEEDIERLDIREAATPGRAD